MAKTLKKLNQAINKTTDTILSLHAYDMNESNNGSRGTHIALKSKHGRFLSVMKDAKSGRLIAVANATVISESEIFEIITLNQLNMVAFRNIQYNALLTAKATGELFAKPIPKPTNVGQNDNMGNKMENDTIENENLNDENVKNVKREEKDENGLRKVIDHPLNILGKTKPNEKHSLSMTNSKTREIEFKVAKNQEFQMLDNLNKNQTKYCIRSCKHNKLLSARKDYSVEINRLIALSWEWWTVQYIKLNPESPIAKKSHKDIFDSMSNDNNKKNGNKSDNNKDEKDNKNDENDEINNGDSNENNNEKNEMKNENEVRRLMNEQNAVIDHLDLFSQQMEDNNVAINIYKNGLLKGDINLPDLVAWKRLNDRILKKYEVSQNLGSELRIGEFIKSKHGKIVDLTGTRHVDIDDSIHSNESKDNENENEIDNEIDLPQLKSDLSSSHAEILQAGIGNNDNNFFDDFQRFSNLVKKKIVYCDESLEDSISKREFLEKENSMANRDIEKCQNEVNDIETKIMELMQEKETKMMELTKLKDEIMRRKSKIEETLDFDAKIMNTKEIYCNQQNSIENACEKYNQFLENYKAIKQFLRKKYKKFELNYKAWDCEDVITWLSLIENEKFKLKDDCVIHNVLDLNKLDEEQMAKTMAMHKEEKSNVNDINVNSGNSGKSGSKDGSDGDNESKQNGAISREHEYKALFYGIRKSNICGKDLRSINDLILRSFHVSNENDRKLIVSNIQRIIKNELEYREKYQSGDGNDMLNGSNDSITTMATMTTSTSMQNRGTDIGGSCVVCMEHEADNVCIPCGHLCICNHCAEEVKETKKCVYCGNEITDVIRSYSVGVSNDD